MRWLAVVGSLLALLSLPAEARMHAPYRGHRIVLGGAALDGFPQPAAAYSLRKLKSSYSGSAIRLRRASDNLETDIGFVGFVPGLGSPLDVAAANAHCAATTCFLRTWYDQSGGARDLVQATPASQLQWLASCVGGKPCLRGVGGGLVATAATYSWTSPVSLSGVDSLNATDGGAVECRWIMAGSNNLQTFAAPWYLLATGNIGTAVPSVGAWHSQQGVINGASSVLAVDGTETPGTVTAIPSAGSLQVGYAGPAGSTCDFAEAIVWSGYALTPAERTALQTNQKSFWGTP